MTNDTTTPGAGAAAKRRYVVHLTRAQHEAVLEALTSRLAGPIESEQRIETYEAAERAVANAALQTVREQP